MTFDDLKSFLEKKNRKCAILDDNFEILWDRDGFFSPRRIKFPDKNDFKDKDEIIISLGNNKAKFPVSITKFKLSGGETRYICEAFDKEIISELASKSEISELLRNYFAGINNEIQKIKFHAEQCAENASVKNNNELLRHHEHQADAALELLALTTDLNFYFNTFPYSDDDSIIDVFKTVDSLVKTCNALLPKARRISLGSNESERFVRIHERVFSVVFLNLIKKALLYSEEGKKIEVKVFCDNHNTTVSVTNEIAENFSPESAKTSLGISWSLVDKIAKGVGGKAFREKAGSTHKAHVSLPLYESFINKTTLKNKDAVFFTHQESYVKRYLNQFIEK
jgi:hypothetical protein